MDPLLARAAEDLLGSACPPDQVRAIRRGGSADALWAAIEASGFLDALRPEAEGGAGLALPELLPLLLACGGFAVPVPLAETCLIRAAAGPVAPEGPLALGQAVAGGIRARIAISPRLARWVLVPRGAAPALLLPVEAASGAAEADPIHGALLSWPDAAPGRALAAGGTDWLVAGAFLEAARMAGAMLRLLEEATRYAGERRQFGRPIGGFQAVQQQLAVLAEEAHAARIAAGLAAIPAPAGGLDPLRVAAAKARIGEGAARAAAIAHAVLGAMGITEEVPLHLYSLALHRGRLAFGATGHWAARLGRAALAEPGDSLGFVRRHLGPAADPTPGGSPSP